MDTDDLLKAILVLVAIFVLAPLISMVLFVPMLFGFGHSGPMGAGGMGGWWFVSLLPLVILVGAGYLLYSTLRSGGGATDPAIEELRAAYARGELTDEEFERRYERLRREETTNEEW